MIKLEVVLTGNIHFINIYNVFIIQCKIFQNLENKLLNNIFFAKQYTHLERIEPKLGNFACSCDLMSYTND